MKRLKKLKILILTLGLVFGAGVCGVFAMKKNNTDISTKLDYTENQKRTYYLLEFFKVEIEKAEIKLKILEKQNPRNELEIEKTEIKINELRNKILEITNDEDYNNLKIDPEMEKLNDDIQQINNRMAMLNSEINSFRTQLFKLRQSIREVEERINNETIKKNLDNLKKFKNSAWYDLECLINIIANQKREIKNLQTQKENIIKQKEEILKKIGV